MIESERLARKAREKYALTKAIVLEDVADGRRSGSEAIRTLEQQYTAATLQYLRSGRRRSEWNEHGPLAELEEVLDAYAKGGGVWSALLERVRKAREERTNVG